MFDVGFWELVLIAIIALLVVGPERLPAFAMEAGKWLGKIRRLINNTRRELEREINLDSHTEFKQQLTDLDDLIQNAPDQDPDFINKSQTDSDSKNTRSSSSNQGMK